VPALTAATIWGLYAEGCPPDLCPISTQSLGTRTGRLLQLLVQKSVHRGRFRTLVCVASNSSTARPKNNRSIVAGGYRRKEENKIGNPTYHLKASFSRILVLRAALIFFPFAYSVSMQRDFKYFVVFFFFFFFFQNKIPNNRIFSSLLFSSLLFLPSFHLPTYLTGRVMFFI